MRIGHGYDVHRFTDGEYVILGGVRIPYEKALLAHSDGDVLAHAIADALLGAAGERDIGYFFPDTDESFKNANSLKLLAEVKNIIENETNQKRAECAIKLLLSSRSLSSISNAFLNDSSAFSKSPKLICTKPLKVIASVFSG